MAEERYTADLNFRAIEENAPEGSEPMVESTTRWRRMSYTGLVMLEDRLVNGVLGETVKWSKTSTNYLGPKD